MGPRVSGEDPERIRVDSVVETLDCLSACSLFFVSKFSNFSLFHPSLIIQYSTEECSTVQYKAAGPVRAVIFIRYGSKEGVQGSCWSPNIFGHKMVTSGWILMFHVFIEPY